uniref:Uncharacterized protein n=1 Tax=Rangifer tarandus platyrhynchus TaxID=3082113 RepID=A0ACB0F824_RANTA|nr:unnamed protein product [Rangifer tarandus platyrhynchus]
METKPRVSGPAPACSPARAVVMLLMKPLLLCCVRVLPGRVRCCASSTRGSRPSAQLGKMLLRPRPQWVARRGFLQPPAWVPAPSRAVHTPPHPSPGRPWASGARPKAGEEPALVVAELQSSPSGASYERPAAAVLRLL